jgi:hypothetical protein
MTNELIRLKCACDEEVPGFEHDEIKFTSYCHDEFEYNPLQPFKPSTQQPNNSSSNPSNTQPRNQSSNATRPTPTHTQHKTPILTSQPSRAPPPEKKKKEAQTLPLSPSPQHPHQHPQHIKTERSPSRQKKIRSTVSPGKARTFNLLMCHQAGCGITVRRASQLRHGGIEL